MIRTAINDLAESIGFDIGMGDDRAQSDLLNGFARALSGSMNDNDRDRQICYFVDKLTPQAREVMREIAEYCNLKDGKK